VSRLVCTITTRRRIPEARALAWSLRTHDRSARLLVLLLDDRRHTVNPAEEPFALVRPESLDIPRFGVLAGMHAPKELELVISPAFLRYALDRAAGPVLHLSTDTLVYAPLDEVFSLLARHSAVLIPRLHAPVPRDHVRLTDAEIAKQGVFDHGSLGLRPGEDIDVFLRAWSDRLEYDRGDEIPLPSGRFLDLLPGFIEAVRVLVDPGFGVSQLNLHERRVTRSGGRWQAGGRRLATARFDGMDGAEDRRPPRIVSGRRRLNGRRCSAFCLIDRTSWLSLFVNGRFCWRGAAPQRPARRSTAMPGWSTVPR